MAQLKDLLVSGASRLIGKLFVNEAQITTLDIPTTSGGTTYGPGTSGNYLRTNGTSIYWDALDASDIPNIDVSKITSGTLPVSRGGTGLSSLTSGYALIGNGTSSVSLRAITNNTSATAVTASTNLITANTLYYHKGNSNIVTVGTISSGTWQGTTIGVGYGGTGKTSWTKYGVLYADATNSLTNTGVGTSGHLLMSNGGTSAPSWKDPGTLDVNTAKTLKTARNISVGDITKSFNGSADISFPTKDMGIKYMDLNPTVSKKYESTSYYATSSGSWETSTWYFMSVKPTAWYKPWTVRFKVHTFEPSYSNAESISYCTVSGREQSFVYANWNERYDTAHYYTTIYPLKKAGFDAGYGHAIGISILYGYNYTNSAHYRTFEIDYYDCDNCEVTLLDTPVQWASWTGTGSTNYNGINSMNAVDRGLQESGDANDYTTIRSYYDRITAGTNGLKQYSLAMQDSTGAWQSFTTDYGTGTSKTKNTTGFILGDIVYLNTSSNTTNGNIVGWNVVTRYQGLIDYRYTFNCGTGLTANKMVYIVGSLGTDGLFYLADTWWTQTLPTSEDGKLYIPVGIPYPDSGPYRGDFSGWHTPLWYKDGKVIPFYNNAVRQTAVTASSYTNWRSLIWGSANSGTEGFTPTTVTDRVYSTSTLSVQPSTGTIKATTFKGALSGNVTGNASSATKLQTARTIWGQSFNGTANISGNMIDMGPQVKLPSGQTTWQFLTSTGGAGYANFGRLGLNGTYANIDLTNYVLDVSGKTRVSDTIYRAFTASNAGPMLWMNGNDYDNWLFTISSGTSNNMYFGFGLKYIGTGSGNANYLDLYADNQNGTEVLALRVDQAGTLTGKQLTLTGNLTVTGDAYLNSNTYAEGITTNTLVVNGASSLIGVTTHSNNVQPNTTNAYSLGTSSARWSKLYVGTADSYGSGTQPIYWDAGVPKACSYSISATINSSTATYMAYYSGANAISGTSYARMIDGCLNLYPANGSYREGMRIHPYGGWSDITLMGNTNTNTSSIAATDWFIGNNSGTFYITHAGSSSSSTGYLKASTENSAGYWQLYQRVGINGISNTYNFYVNGTSYLNGALTAAGTIYVNAGMHWKAGTNWACDGVTANGQEWSFDLTSGSYTGTYWHVWSGKNSKSILACYNDDNKVTIPSGGLQVQSIIANTGSYTAAKDNGSGNNRYQPLLWTFNLGIPASRLESGLVVIIKMPSAGHDYGVFLSVDNGTTYKPISSNTGTNRLTTHYGNGTTLVLCYDASGQTNSVFPVAGSTSRTNITGGCWRPISSYDDGNPGEWNLRQYNIKAQTAITAVHLIGGTDSGYNHIDNGTPFDIRYAVMYAGSNIGAGSAGSNNFIHHYAINVRNSSNSNISNFTSYKNVYIKGTLNGNIFTPISGGNPYVQDITTEEDGYVYYYIGRAYSSNAITFDATAQSIYCYKDGAVRPYEDYSSLSNGYAYPYGNSDKPWHLVAEFNQSTNGQQINTKIVFLVSNFYSDEKSGILEVAIRWESNGTTPGFVRNNWLVCKDLTPSDFVTTWKYNSSTKMVNIHVYAKLTGWTSLNFTRLAEHNWGATKKEWIFHRAIYSSSYALASIPTDETQVASTITDIKNNAATATTANSCSGNAATSTKTGVAGIWWYPENNNELNIGGTNTSTTIYIGYRAKDSRAIPTKFIFGSSTGTADLQVKTVYLGSGTTSYISSSQYTGNAATATKISSNGSSGQLWGMTSGTAQGWINQSALSVGDASRTRYVICPDTRNTNPAPSDYTATTTGVSFDFKTSSVVGLSNSATYSGVMTYRPYASGSDWSGGNAHQLAFNNNGLYWRNGGSSWGSWLKLVLANYGTALPTSGMVAGDVYFQLSDVQYELPAGGSANQVLTKNSAADRDVKWATLNAGTVTMTLDNSTKYYVAGSSSATTATISPIFNTSVYVQSSKLYGAAWNDYAEFRSTTDKIEPGRVVIENGDDTLSLSTKRLQPGAEIVSDTYGFAIGETASAQTPIATTGRVLAYTNEPRNTYKPGQPVCSGPNGTVSQMTDEEAAKYPWLIIGTVSAIPKYKTWNDIEVKGRIWIRIR